MADPTTFSIPRRRMAIGAYSDSDTTLIKLRDVGVINAAEVSFEAARSIRCRRPAVTSFGCASGKTTGGKPA